MNKQIVIGLATLMATAVIAADPKDEVKGAAKKLAEASGYSWKMTTEVGGGGGGRWGGPTEGMTLKDGTVCLSMTRGDTTTEAFLQGAKGAIKTADGWQSLQEAAEPGQGGGQGGGGRMIARTLQNYKTPATTVAEMVDKLKSLKKEGDAYVGEMTEEGAKDQMLFGRGRGAGGGGNAPEVSGAKGSVKIWIKDGVLAKYELRVQGTINFNGNDREIDRTTTVEVKNVGSTKITIPDAAKQKMS